MPKVETKFLTLSQADRAYTDQFDSFVKGLLDNVGHPAELIQALNFSVRQAIATHDGVPFEKPFYRFEATAQSEEGQYILLTMGSLLKASGFECSGPLNAPSIGDSGGRFAVDFRGDLRENLVFLAEFVRDVADRERDRRDTPVARHPAPGP